MPRRLMLTVDVEAQTHRAVESHVDRLIWGIFPEGPAGIGEMMNIADKHGVKLTMFLDWAESDKRGDSIRDVGREIDRRGHDLQLHVHTDYFSPEFWESRGARYEIDLNILSPEQADVVADEIAARQIDATGKAPLAFRGGGYRYSANLLNSLRRNGVLIDTSVNVSRSTQPVDLALSRQFRWSNGMIEVPVSNVAKYRNCPRALDFNFNSAYFTDAGRMLEYLDNFWSERGDDAIAVLVMHSWSLLKLHEDGIFRYDGQRNAERLDALLGGLGTDVEVVTSSDVVELDRNGALAIDPDVDLGSFAEARQRRAEGAKEPGIPYAASSSVMGRAGYTSLSCPICGAAKGRFMQMNGRKCPDCGSVERQRSFAVAYQNGIRERFDVSGKRVLIFSPSVSELRFLNRMGLNSKTSADIRPDAKPDIILDMCAMPSIESHSQEFVFASYLMPVVYDMDAALDEVERVLQPQGAFISIEPLQAAGPTREIVDRESQASWYGTEALEKYKVGSYRTLGEADYLAELEKRFAVERFTARDPITGQVNRIHLCWSRKPASALVRGIEGAKETVGRLKSLLMGDKGQSMAAVSRDDLNAMGEALWGDRNADSQKQSVELFHQLYDMGDRKRAGYRLGTAYYLGRGVSRDLQKAYSFLSIPDLDKTRYALYYRGLILRDPGFPGRDEFGARKVLKQAHEMGVKEAAEHLTENLQETNVPLVVAARGGGEAAAEKPAVSCTVCGFDLSTTPQSEPNCPNCRARPRTRVFVDFAKTYIKPIVDNRPRSDKPLLAFAMTDMEQKILAPHFDSFKSVSLYGNYRQGHESGVDARDLSRYADGAFAGHHCILLFDYFSEHEQALKEAYRVTEDGGLFIHHMNTARLVEGSMPPKAAYTIQKRAGYFDYVPDEAAMPSVKVGIDWFLAAMKSIGFESRHIVMNDRHTGEAIHWFLGIKPVSNRRQAPASRAYVDGAGIAVSIQDCPREEANAFGPKTYSVPIHGLDGIERIEVGISVPPLPKSLKNCYFAEHVYDATAGESSEEIVVTDPGMIGYSTDLGSTWKSIELHDFKHIRFHSCFTTRSGRHLVQAIGWQGMNDTPEPESYHGQIFVFSNNWELVGISQAGCAQWHGSASISEKDGVIMFGEYHNNSAKYYADFDNSNLKHTVLPCKIWRSQDDGLTWECVLEKSPLEIRHFHTVVSDPFEPRTWYASSGDKPDECFVWKSDNNGESWIVCNDPDPKINVPAAFASRRVAAHRFTDLVIQSDRIFWGADDWMGDTGEYDARLPEAARTGSRIYSTTKTTPFALKEIGYVGPPVRTLTAVDHGWIVTTEAKGEISGRRATIFFLSNDFTRLSKLFDVDNFRNRDTALSFSRASRRARNGMLFMFREHYDAFDGGPRLLKLEMSFH